MLTSTCSSADTVAPLRVKVTAVTEVTTDSVTVNVIVGLIILVSPTDVALYVYVPAAVGFTVIVLSVLPVFQVAVVLYVPTPYTEYDILTVSPTVALTYISVEK